MIKYVKMHFNNFTFCYYPWIVSVVGHNKLDGTELWCVKGSVEHDHSKSHTNFCLSPNKTWWKTSLTYSASNGRVQCSSVVYYSKCGLTFWRRKLKSSLLFCRFAITWIYDVFSVLKACFFVDIYSQYLC